MNCKCKGNITKIYNGNLGKLTCTIKYPISTVLHSQNVFMYLFVCKNINTYYQECIILIKSGSKNICNVTKSISDKMLSFLLSIYKES